MLQKCYSNKHFVFFAHLIPILIHWIVTITVSILQRRTARHRKCKCPQGHVASQMAQWQRIHLLTQETQEIRFRFLVGKIPRRTKWQPTPGFLPGKVYGQRSLVGYSLLGHKELDTTDWAHTVPGPRRLEGGKARIRSWWTGRPGLLRFMGSQRVGHDWATEVIWTELYLGQNSCLQLHRASSWVVNAAFPTEG